MRRKADLIGSDAYPAQTPQAESDSTQRDNQMGDPRPDYTEAPEPEPVEYAWAMTGSFVSVNKDADPQDLFVAMGHGDFSRPYAYGKLVLHARWDAVWQIEYANMGLHMVEQRLKRYSKEQGWSHVGITDESGMPFSGLGIAQSSVKEAEAVGVGDGNYPDMNWGVDDDSPVTDVKQVDYYGEKNAPDETDPEGPRVCSECGQMCFDYDDWRLHTLRDHINPDRTPPTDPQPVVDLDQTLPANFNTLVMDKTVQRQSRLIFQLTKTAMGLRGELPEGLSFDFKDLSDDYGQRYQIDAVVNGLVVGYLSWSGDTIIDVDVNLNLRRRGIATALLQAAEQQVGHSLNHSDELSDDGEAWSEHFGAEQVLSGPIPFIYDIESDRILVGHPGERHSDIQGRFTPGGIVEGLYQPDGKLQIRTDTDMPYTVRHMAELWYYMHPELVIKGILKMVGEKSYKLASANIGHKVRNMAATHPAVWSAFEALKPYGNVYVVGGAVRDVILGKVPNDFDLMVQGIEPHDLIEIMGRLPGQFLRTGDQFPVYRYKVQDDEVEIALPRTERSTGEGTHDFEVEQNPFISVGEDMARRDFTVNAMAVNLESGDLVDPYHGSEHAKAGILDSHNPNVFAEDPLRILRALTAVSRHGLAPSPQLYQQLREQAPSLAKASPDRIGEELQKIMKGEDPAAAMELAMQTGVMQYLFPEVYATLGFDQKSKYHSLLLDDHIMQVLRLTAQQTTDPDVRIAALLHDIGKPPSQWFDEEGLGHYYQNEKGEGLDHEHAGADMAKEALERIRIPGDRIARIEHLVRSHMFPPFSSTGGARKFLNKYGDEHADDLMKIRWADAGGKSNDGSNPTEGSTALMSQYIQHVREAQEPTNLKALAINGNDLIQAGMQPGPQMGATLNWLMDAVLEDPSLNDKVTLLRMVLDGAVSPSNEQGQGTTSKVSNILDPIKDGLDSAVFNRAQDPDPDVKPQIREWVRRTIYKIMISKGWPDPAKYLSLVLTGSLTTYQWGEESDFDVSLWVDSKQFPEWVRAELISMMIEHAEGLIVPGTTHPLQAFVVDVNRYEKPDLYKPGIRSGYDLDKGEWIVLPEKMRSIDVQKTYPALMNYVKTIEDKVRLLLRYDHVALKIYWKNLHMRRFNAMKAGKGDYDENNIAYKWLSHQGLFPAIAEATGTHIAKVEDE